MKQVKNVFIQLIHKPMRKVLIKRGKKASDYFAYCEEVGCDVWGLLTSIKSISGEPVCLWLPEAYRKSETSEYVQGVEVPIDYDGEIPEDFDVITLPEADYLMFQGEPFLEEDYCHAIEQVQESMKKYHPEIIGYLWDTANPRIQLGPIGKRGYIEMLAVKKAEL
jgi:AraC family transcriptional regulator